MRPPDLANFKPVPPPRRELAAWLQGVTRYFDQPHFARSLSNVSFEVRRGEVFGLLGPSGSGKSTTLRILAGRLPPSEGKAWVFDHPPRRRAARTRVGYLPQRPSHTKSHLVAQAMGFLRDLFVWRERNPQPEAVDLVPEKQRRAILKQVLSKNPDLLLLDEPFAELDPAGCAEMKHLIVTLARRGKTILLTSDSLIYTKDVCDRFAVYYAGKVEALGTLEEILATTDAIRVTGPVLPPETALRVLGELRENLLGRLASAAELSILRPQGDPRIAVPAAVAESAIVATTAGKGLAPVVESPRKVASNAVRERITSPVNNDRLAALTKPAPTATPHLP